MKMNRFFAALPSFALFLCAMLLAPATFGDQKKVGVLVATTALSASGTGSFAFLVPALDFGWTGSDYVSVSLRGESRFEVWQTETNLVIGDLIRASSYPSVTGLYREVNWCGGCNPPSGPSTSEVPYGIATEWPWPSPSTNSCVGFGPDGEQGYLGGTGYPAIGMGNPPNGNPGGDPQDGVGTWGVLNVWKALEKAAANFSFHLPEKPVPCTFTFATNTVSHTAWPQISVGFNVGDATATNRVSLEFIPDPVVPVDAIFDFNAATPTPTRPTRIGCRWAAQMRQS